MKYRSFIAGFVLLIISVAPSTLRAQVDTPSVPMLISPLANEVAKSPEVTFVWNSSENAFHYTLMITADSLGTIYVLDKSFLKDTTITLSNLPVNKKIWWKVIAYNHSAARTSNEVRSIQTFPMSGIPAKLIAPKKDTLRMDTFLEFMWNSIVKADKYVLELSLSRSFKPILSDTLSDTTKIVEGLTPFTQYYWRVKPLIADSSGIWSDVWSFLTRVDPITQVELATPVDSAVFSVLDTNTTYRNFMWYAVSSAEKYQIHISYSPLFDTTILDSIFTAKVEFTTKLFFENATYYWRVRAYNELGWGQWSDTRQFSHAIFNSVVGENKDDIVVFPNPAIHSITVRGSSLASGARLELMNILGEVLTSEEVLVGVTDVNLSLYTIPSGIYLLRITTDKGEQTIQRIAVER